MSLVRADPFESIVAYDPHGFASWKFYFLSALDLGEFSNILDGTEPQNNTDYEARNRTIYRVLVKSVGKCPLDTEKGIATAILQKFTNKDGKAAFQALVQHHENPTQQNKMSATKQFISRKMRLGETVSGYKLRLDADYRRITELKVTLEDLLNSVFIDGLTSDFDGLKTTLYTTQDLTYERAFETAKAHAARLEEQKASERALGNPSSRHALLTEVVDHEGDVIATDISREEFALLSSHRSGKGTPSKSGGAKRKLVHDPENHPHDPTEFEKTLTCDSCNIFGHARRTCKKKGKTEHSMMAIPVKPAGEAGERDTIQWCGPL